MKASEDPNPAQAGSATTYRGVSAAGMDGLAQPDGAVSAHHPASSELDLGMSGLSELRIHGVSGTPPEQVLDHPLLRRVDGDSRAGFYRRRYPGGHSDDLQGSGRVEAYSWGGLTSGSVARAAWVILLPFMLVNLAYWMLPSIPDGSGRARRMAASLAAAVLRLIALSLTMTIVLASAYLAMDMAAWQCAAIQSCAEGSGFLGFMHDGALGSPPRRLAVAATVGIVVLMLLSLPGRGTLQRSKPAPDVAITHERDEPLRHESFWRGNPGLSQLRSAHLAAVTALLTVALTWPVSRFAATDTDRAVGVGLSGGAAVALAVAALLSAAGPVSGREADPDALTASGRALRRGAAKQVTRVAGLLMVSALVYAGWPRAHLVVFRDDLPGMQNMILGLFTAQVALLLMLVLTVAAQRPWAADTGPSGITAKGFAAPAVTTFAWLAAGAATAGVTFRAAELLGHPVLSYEDARAELAATASVIADPSAPLPARMAAVSADTPIVVPPAYSWAGLAAFVLTVALLLAVGYALLVVRSRTRTWRPLVLRDYVSPQAAPTGVDEAQPGTDTESESTGKAVHGIARAWALASLTDHAGRIISRMAQVSGVVIAALAVLYLLDAGTWELVTLPVLAIPTRAGTWLIGLIGVGTLLVLSQTARNATARRLVGIAWDIGTFWPRTAHPMAPPCYAERAVPDIVDRIEALTTGPDDRVILSGHSQGSVLAAAALLQLEPQTARQVRLLTHGSPLRRLYARFFPAYLGHSTLLLVERVAGEAHWVNLYRNTDPIGAWVLSPEPGGLDRRLRDPHELTGPVLGHTGYWFDPEYDRARREVLRSEP